MFNSRRFILSILGILTLTYIGHGNAANVSAVAWPIASIAMGMAAANAFEASKKQ